ncbi:MAG: phosphoglycerate dehydrogenase [FCB group bacterium]|nr:phosphoglycerate dehydrogenase [FCB group bacterium]
MSKILVTARAYSLQGEEAFKYLKDQGHEIIFNPFGEFNLPEEKIITLVPDVDAIIAGEDYITEKVINSAGQLKIISKVGIGLDRIDIPAATKRGIPVTNTPDANCQSVADLTFALLLSLARRVLEANGYLRAGEWKPLIGTELWKKTIGIIGLGRIGRAVARRAKGFDMEILAYDVVQDEVFSAANNIRYVSLDELFKESDFISIHVPGSASTKYLIGADELEKMKSCALLINTSRGGVVDEKALIQALKNGTIAGAALDVFEKEPAMGNPLLDLPNVVATPHMSSYSRESLGRMCMTSAENAVQVLKGEIPGTVVNPEVNQN